MITTHKLQTALNEIKDISKVDLALYTDKGKLQASTFDPDEELAEAAGAFIESMADSQMIGGRHFFKIEVNHELEYVLVTSSDAEDAYMVGRLAAAQIRNLSAAYMEQTDRNHFMQNILLGNMLVVDMYNKAQKLHIDQVERVVYVIELEDKKESDAAELLRHLFAAGTRDFVTELDDDSIILIKDASELKTEEDLESVASVIVDNIQSEAMVRVRVGYGSRVTAFQGLAGSYQEAKMALEVGKLFYAEREILSYKYLGIGRMIYQLPMPLCEMFIREVFGDEIPDIIFNEETMTTIQKFFENNLNISETARQLYVHRNTLVYRLERLQKEIGLDIRRFEDAMTFKIALMVLTNYNSRK